MVPEKPVVRDPRPQRRPHSHARRGPRRGGVLLGGGLALVLGVTVAGMVASRAGDGAGRQPAGGTGAAGAGVAGPGLAGSGPVGTEPGGAGPAGADLAGSAGRDGSGGPGGSGLAASGATGPGAGGPGGAGQPGGGGAESTTSVRFSFDPGAARMTSGSFALHIVTAAGGTVTFPPHGTGAAARFPARCRAATGCPRAILESSAANTLNPGTRDLRYGAAVFMTAADTAAGANVVQKGYSTNQGTQFKLQVDGAAGRPSCVLASATTIYRLTAPVTVADGRWHSIRCTRIAGALSINVDGRAVARRVPASLSIVNGQPLRIGGKNVGPANDQFAGMIDDVFVTIS